MSYQVLARKWRPRVFAEMVGQEHVLKALINALDQGRLHHAYLFTGTRGVGKTTIARILAKCLNCETGVRAVPCGTCAACVEVSEGRFVDLIEVDAASRTKVEDTRDLLENVQYLPSRGRYKVYLIDEVHMLSGHSFNALLKTLEEPPPHVKFLLATTDPQKLPVTVLSRCLQFNLKNLAPERIAGHLANVLRAENIPFEEAGLWALARAADGSLRDALSLADQAVAQGGGQVLEAEVNAMLGTIDRSRVLALCQAIAAGDGPRVLELVESLAELAPDYSDALAAMIALWHRVAVAQAVPEALDERSPDHAAIGELAAALDREAVQLFYQICLLGRRDLPFSGDPRVGFEMILLRQLAFQPVPSAAAAGAPPANGRDAVREAPRPAKKPEPESAAPGGSPEPPQPAPADAGIALCALRPELWPRVCGALGLGGLAGNTAENLELVGVAGTELRFRLDAGSAALYEDGHRQRLQAALADYFGSAVTAVVEVGDLPAESPRAAALRAARERRARAVAELRADPVVGALVERFDGVLLEDSVVPLDDGEVAHERAR
ncbi:MAG: DNA polymerase III subunit gamma/tau [Pseudomonadota bacterium]